MWLFGEGRDGLGRADRRMREHVPDPAEPLAADIGPVFRGIRIDVRNVSWLQFGQLHGDPLDFARRGTPGARWALKAGDVNAGYGVGRRRLAAARLPGRHIWTVPCSLRVKRLPRVNWHLPGRAAMPSSAVSRRCRTVS